MKFVVGEGRLREVFLKTDNDFGGKYFAQMIKVNVINRVTMYTIFPGQRW